MSGHKGIQGRWENVQSSCRSPHSIAVFTGSSRTEKRRGSGVSSLGDSSSQPGARPVVDPKLRENSVPCRARVGLSSPHALWLFTERKAGGVSFPVKNRTGLSKTWRARRGSGRQSGASKYLKKRRPWAPAVTSGPGHLYSLWPPPPLAFASYTV